MKKKWFTEEQLIGILREQATSSVSAPRAGPEVHNTLIFDAG